MRVRKRIRDFTSDANGLVDGKLALPRQAGTQRFARDERHDVVEATVGISTIEKRKYVRMLKTSRRPDLREKAVGAERGSELRLQYLDCDVAIVTEIMGEVYRCH